MIYIASIPADDDLPAGWVVVHNRVEPQPVVGVNGFRAWIEPHDDGLLACDCGWARGILHHHYRVDLPGLG